MAGKGRYGQPCFHTHSPLLKAGSSAGQRPKAGRGGSGQRGAARAEKEGASKEPHTRLLQAARGATLRDVASQPSCFGFTVWCLEGLEFSAW